jgi:hypothetical protein
VAALATLGDAAGWFVAGGALTVIGVGLGLFAWALVDGRARAVGATLALLSLVVLLVGLSVVSVGVAAARCAPDAYECPL